MRFYGGFICSCDALNKSGSKCGNCGELRREETIPLTHIEIMRIIQRYNKPPLKVCTVCNKRFYKANRQSFCSDACYEISKHNIYLDGNIV